MVGTEIGNYRIVEKIGSGGMGVVYKAVDMHLDRVVAVKALNPEVSGNPALLERFRAEARAQAQLNHPNLATLYAFLVQDDVAYMVMEFVDGETFHAMVASRGAIPAEEAVPLFRQALAGIGHAHSHGIVHRDIKPSNIMVNRDGVVKVMDFGLAKVTGNHGITRTGVRLGTAYYMSPEQILVKPVDFRSDIYSLGVTLYEMLTGQAPFRADSEFQILNDHVNTAPPPPSRLHPQIPGGIEHAVLKALAKDPDQRFQNVEQFSAALEHPQEFYMAATVADGAPVPPELQIKVASPPFWTLSRKLLAGSLAALVCVLAAAVVLRPKPRPQAPDIVQPPRSTEIKPTPMPVAHPVQTAESAAPPPVAAPPVKMAVPAGTVIWVSTVDPIDSKSSRVGQEFLAKLTDAVKVNDREVFHVGDEARLRLGKASVLELASITSDGKSYRVSAAPFTIKAGFLRKKRVAPATHIDFTLDAPVSVAAP